MFGADRNELKYLGGSVSSASDFSSRHDLMVHELRPTVSTEPASDPLSSLSAPSLLMHSLSLLLFLKNKLLLIFFMFIYLFWEREIESKWGRGRERERDWERGSQVGSTLSAQRSIWGSDSQSTRWWPEPKPGVGCLTNWAIQAPQK